MIGFSPRLESRERLVAPACVLVVALAASLGGAAYAAGPVVPAALAAVTALAIAVVAHQRHQWVPVVLLVAASALGVLLFLPASAGDEGQRIGLERYGLLSGGAVLLAAAMTLVSRGRQLTLVHPSSATLDRLMLLFAALAGMAGIVGLASGNSLSYLVGDVYRIGSLPVVYLVTVHAIQKPGHLRTVLCAVALCLVLQHVRDAHYAATVFLSSDEGRLKSVFWIQNLVGVLALVILAFDRNRGAVRTAALYSAGFLLLVGLSRGFRTYIVTLFVLLAVPLVARPGKALGMGRGASSALLICGPALLLAAMFVPAIPKFIQHSADSFTERVQLASSGQDSSAEERSLELSLVKEQLREDRTAAVVGKGAGAVYQLPPWASPYALQAYADDQGRIHNVHNSYGSMVLRTGITGLFAIIALFAFALWSGFRLVRRWDSLLSWFPFLTVVAYALASPFFYFVPGDLLFAVALGLMGAAYRLGLASGTQEDPEQAGSA